MNKVLHRISTFLSSDRAVPLTLAVVCLAAYAPGIGSMGFYWDDWAMNWIAQNLGHAGLIQYFSTNRPVYGLLYLVTTPLVGSNPLAWQLIAILVRFMMALAAWGLVRQVWPKQNLAALVTSLLFVVYPGFTQQHVALVYTHHFLVIIFLLTSLLCTLVAVRKPRRFWLFTILALLLSLANLLMMEYFFMLDLLRPLLILIVLGEQVGRWRERIWRAFKLWVPYLVVFIGAGIWRAFFFPYTQENYKLLFFDLLKAHPLLAANELITKATSQIWTAFGAAWGRVFQIPTPDMAVAAGDINRFALLIGLVLLFLLVVLLLQKISTGVGHHWGWQALLVGGAALFLAGWPFWLTDVPFSLNFANDRFTLPFMLGVSLVLAGVFDLAPLWRPAKAVILAVLVTLAVAWQVEIASSYVQDWQLQSDFFQQLTWRVPGLTPGTTIFSNELPIHPTDNSLTAPLNWIYAPGDPGQRLPYLMNWPTIRLGSLALPSLDKSQPVVEDYLVSVFKGSTDQSIAIYYHPPGCLLLLDYHDGNNPRLPGLLKSAAVLSNPALVRSQTSYGPAKLISDFFNPAQEGSWCEYYEKAALAWQQEDWSTIGKIAAQAGDLVQKANAPDELFPFIESFAHLNDWGKVGQLSNAEASYLNPEERGQMCIFLTGVQKSTPSDPSKTIALTQSNQSLGCGLEPNK